jgi:hypothetical protein
VRSLNLVRRDGTVELQVQLTRPAALSVAWGKAAPLDQSADSDEAKSLHTVALPGLAKGAWFLLRLEAESPRFGSCLLRTRWVRAPL